MLDRVASEMVSHIESIAERVGASVGLQIVEVEVRGSANRRLVRIYIYKPEGVTHGDCEKVSQQVGAILDVEDVIPGSYTLEVSSPGAERKLRTAKDFTLFRGRKARVTLREPVEGSKLWEGALAPAGEGRVGIEAAGGKTVEFPLELVERANLKL